jgi:hypothetical protein
LVYGDEIYQEDRNEVKIEPYNSAEMRYVSPQNDKQATYKPDAGMEKEAVFSPVP